MTLIFAIANYFLRPYLFLCLWTWTAVDILHLRPFSFWQIFLFWLFLAEILARREFKKTSNEDDEYQLAMSLGTTALALLFAFAAHKLA